MNYKIVSQLPASTDNVPSHHAVMIVGSATGASAGITFYDPNGNTGPTATILVGKETQILPIRVKNTGVCDNTIVYGLA